MNKLIFLIMLLFVSCGTWTQSIDFEDRLFVMPVGWNSRNDIISSLDSFKYILSPISGINAISIQPGYSIEISAQNEVVIRGDTGATVLYMPLQKFQITVDYDEATNILYFEADSILFLILSDQVNQGNLRVSNSARDISLRFVGELDNPAIYMPFSGRLSQIMPNSPGVLIEDDAKENVLISNESLDFILLDVGALEINPPTNVNTGDTIGMISDTYRGMYAFSFQSFFQGEGSEMTMIPVVIY
jgi:hypothetical protein